MFLRYKIIITLLIISTSTSFSQLVYDSSTISDKTLDIVGTIAKKNTFITYARYELYGKNSDSTVTIMRGDTIVRYGYRRTRANIQYSNFVILQKTASIEELLLLTNHPNNNVKAYSFWALAQRDTTHLLPIIIDHISDTGYVRTQLGCFPVSYSIADLFINITSQDYDYDDAYKLNAEQQILLDSALVSIPNEVKATIEAKRRVAYRNNTE